MGVSRFGKSMLAAFVTLTLMLGMVPATVFADGGEADVIAEPDATVQSETTVQPQTYVEPEASTESVEYLETAVEKNDYEPIEISSGFNVDVVADASLEDEAFFKSVNRFIDLADDGGSHAFYCKDSDDGSLPKTREVISKDGTSFKLQPYDEPNALQLFAKDRPTNYPIPTPPDVTSTGTFTLSSSTNRYQKVAVLCTAAGTDIPDAGVSVKVTLKYGDGSTKIEEIDVRDWSRSQEEDAKLTFSRIEMVLEKKTEYGFAMYVKEIDVDPTKELTSIQFDNAHGEIITIFAVSGIPVPWYTIKYDANGGTDEPSDQVKYQGSPIKLSTDKPTRKGYTFKGWAESADAKEAAYQPGDTYTKDEDATFYAVWEEEKTEAVVPTYDAHVQTSGDLAAVTSGPCGVVGESKRLEAFSVKLNHGSIEYRAHVQNHGWMDWKKDGAKAGTTGESRRMEAMQMRLDEATAKQYSVWYRVHSQHLDWMGWAKDGEPAGTVNQSKRVEAYEVQILPKGQTPADYDANKSAFRTAAMGKGHVQGTGWMSELPAALMGTTGQSKRLEAFTLTLPAAVTNIYAGGIAYEAHIQGTGWTGEVADGALAGTTGKSKRIEAVKMHLTGELATHMSVWYRVHSQTFGWGGWVKDGDPAGTTGLSKRAEAIEIAITPQNVAAPGPTTDAFRAG